MSNCEKLCKFVKTNWLKVKIKSMFNYKILFSHIGTFKNILLIRFHLTFLEFWKATSLRENGSY